jgi:hypothetical protein
VARKFIPPLVGEQLIHLVVRITGESISGNFGAFLHAHLREQIDVEKLETVSLEDQVKEALGNLATIIKVLQGSV